MRRLEDAGCFAVEVECIAEEFLTAVNDKTSLVTFSLGSGRGGDAVFSFVERHLRGTQRRGERLRSTPTPSVTSAGCTSQMSRGARGCAMTEFHNETRANNFPYDSTNISMLDGEHEKFLEALDAAT